MQPNGTAPSPAKTRITFVDIGRGLGALLVVYSHLHVGWMRDTNGISTPATGAVSEVLTEPLQLTAADLGKVAVPVFFLVSGYVVTPIALRTGAARFGIGRFFRVYPALVVAVLLAAAALLMGLRPLGRGGPDDVTVLTVLTNSTLVNYAMVPQVALLGVTWTLYVEVLFYLMLMAVLPVLRSRPWLAIATELAVIQAVVTTHGILGPGYREIAAAFSVLALPVMGQAAWAAANRRLSVPVAGLFLLVGWTQTVWATSMEPVGFGEGYTLAVGLAILLFLIGLLAEPQLPQRRLWVVLSERCYSLYLLHGIVMFAVLDLTYPSVPLPAALILALAATAGAVELSYRYVELPTHRLGRRLARGSRSLMRSGATRSGRHESVLVRSDLGS